MDRECEYCSAPVNPSAQYTQYNGNHLCEPCLIQAVADDESNVDECDGCAEIWHPSFLVTVTDGGGRRRFYCPPCNITAAHEKIRKQAHEEAMEELRTTQDERVKRSLQHCAEMIDNAL